jgi:hypothetical protein
MKKVYVVMGSNGDNQAVVERVFSSKMKAIAYVDKEFFYGDYYRKLNGEERKREALRYFIEEFEVDIP